MKECKEISHDNDNWFWIGKDDRFELGCPLCLVLYFWEKVIKDTWVCLCNISWHFNIHNQSHTHGHAPGVGWCCQGGRGDSPDPWSRASILQPQSPCHMFAQLVDPLLQGKPTAHCLTLLMFHYDGGYSVWYGSYNTQYNTHPHSHTYLAQRHPLGCWFPPENLAL